MIDMIKKDFRQAGHLIGAFFNNNSSVTKRKVNFTTRKTCRDRKTRDAQLPIRQANSAHKIKQLP